MDMKLGTSDLCSSQFEGARLESMMNLDKRLDGIAGATLSHWALEKMAGLGFVS